MLNPENIEGIDVVKRDMDKEDRELKDVVFEYLAVGKKRDATELIVRRIETENKIYTTRDDAQSEIWIYNNGIYEPNGRTYIKEYSRKKSKCYIGI